MRLRFSEIIRVFLAVAMPACNVSGVGLAADPPQQPVPKPRILVPGFVVRELPLQLTSLNNIEYAPDGRLFAGGYDGRFHLLQDTDGDGLEDKIETFSPETSSNYPLGLIVKDGEPYALLSDEIVRWRDSNGDGIPDLRETVAKGFDDPELTAAPFLNHRRVDSAMALACGPDGLLYLTLGNAGYNNAYWHDKIGVAHYSTSQRRGCLLRIGADGKAEQLASGLRYIMSLQFNREGDLFGTDQEGATWVPNGNPFDELLHIQAGRHYGFPPRHPRWLNDVVDEPSVWDYAPQHQSTCGFRFNGPAAGRGRFGPDFWSEDAIVTGASRGNLWRTKLAKTTAGYVARTDLIARLGMLAVDCAISPRGDLVVCCHSGQPDWGNGPKGEGHLYQIRFQNDQAPQPVLAWASAENQTEIAFDKLLDPTEWGDLSSRTKINAGRYVEADERDETIRPGYAIVRSQLAALRSNVAVHAVRIGKDGQSLVVESDPRSLAVKYATQLGNLLDLSYDLSGVEADWKGTDGSHWHGWIPHPDLSASSGLTRGSRTHDALWKAVLQPGELTLRGQLDLWQMLIPATQPGAKLDYLPDPETVLVDFQSQNVLSLAVPDAAVRQINNHQSRLTVESPAPNHWLPFTLTLATPAQGLDVSFSTDRDSRPRALGIGRFLMPFAKPAPPDDSPRIHPQVAAGNWQAGREIFLQKGACARCHQFRGEGSRVGPELANVAHRDYASVMKDILDPNAAINPDAVGYTVATINGKIYSGTRVAETADELQLAQPGGEVLRLQKADIEEVEPMKISIMPTGIDKLLTKEELRDLMTYLYLSEQPVK